MGCGDEKETRLEFPPSRPKMDYTQPRFDRIENRVFCHQSGQGFGNGVKAQIHPYLQEAVQHAVQHWPVGASRDLYTSSLVLMSLMHSLANCRPPRRPGTGNHFAISGILLFFIVLLSVPSLAPQPCSLIAFQAHGFMLLRNWKPACNKPDTP